MGMSSEVINEVEHDENWIATVARRAVVEDRLRNDPHVLEALLQVTRARTTLDNTSAVWKALDEAIRHLRLAVGLDQPDVPSENVRG